MENEIVEDFKRFCEKRTNVFLNKWREINSSVAQNRGWHQILNIDENGNTIEPKDEDDQKGSFQFYDQKIKCKISGSKLEIENQDLYKMYSEYKRRRLGKNPISSPLHLWILKRYIFDFLCTSKSDILWNSARKKYPEFPVIAMQLWGINLRISGKPYELNKLKSDKNGTAHYMILAEEINLVIKLLSAYQHQVLNLIKNNIENKKQSQSSTTEEKIARSIVIRKIAQAIHTMNSKK
ncbi:MAG: hypothetical protein ACLU8W_07780 [Clostridia bacterium]